MPSPFGGLSIGLSGLLAAQQAMETASHNVANANTPGYSRQRVNLVASRPYTYPAFNRSGLPGQIGTGVSVASIERVRDAFLDLQIRGELPLQSQWETRRDELGKIETVFPEPSTSGLGSVLGKFWDAWQDLAADPSSTAARSALVEQSQSLASNFNSYAQQLSTLASGADYQVGQQVSSINELAQQIATLNGQIQRVQVSGDNANDLSDQRDQLLDELNKITHVSVAQEADGTVSVQIGGTDLVSGDRARAVTTRTDASGHMIPTWSTGGDVKLGAGSLTAYIQIRDTDVVGYQAKLDELAKGVADAVNTLHTTGVDATGAQGLDFFTYDATLGIAATFAVNTVIADDPSRVAAAATTTGSPPARPAAGDATIAGQIADLRTAKIINGDTQTANDFYAGIVGGVGADSQHAQDMASNEELVVTSLTTRRESTSGVSLDEEATDMLRFQHAYQAASRVITSMDEMLNTLINGTGLVGRG